MRHAHTDMKAPDFSAYRHKDGQDPTSQDRMEGRKTAAYACTGASIIGAGIFAKGIVHPIVQQWSPAADVLALAKVEVSQLVVQTILFCILGALFLCHFNTFFKDKTLKKVHFPISADGRRISSFALLSRRSFGYYLPIASYGTIFAVKWSSNGRLEAVVSK